MGNTTESNRVSVWIKLIAFVILAGIVFTLVLIYGDQLNLSTFAQYEETLQQYQRDNPVLVFFVAFLIYVIVTGLSVPGAAPLTLLYGWYFGLLPGVLLVSFASTTGATVAFLLSRYFFGGMIQAKFGKQLETFNRKLDEEGAFYLFSLRMIPVVPFFVINLVMGLTRISVLRFWWVSQLGMLAGTILYIGVGASVPDLQSLADEGINAVFASGTLIRILIGFALLGVFPLMAKLVVNRIRKAKLKNNDRIEKENSGKIDNE